MNIEISRRDMYNKIENFIINHIRNKKSYNNDLIIGNETIRFSINDEKFVMNCDKSFNNICNKIESFIEYYNF